MAEERINPNSAEAETLQLLPGIGASLAQRIVEGRPYQTADQLLNVPGLGAATLNRIRSRLEFGERPLTEAAADQVADEADEPAAAEGSVEPESPDMAPAESAEPRQPPTAEPGSAEPPTSALAGRPGRRNGLWAAASIVAASVLCSVSLTLVILLGINRTLDIGKHAAVRGVETQLSQLQSDLDRTNSELSGLRQRLQVIEGLSGRMTEVEGQLTQVQTQVDQLSGSLDGIQQQLNQILEQTRAQADQINRFQAFLDGLQQLLGEVLPAP